MGKLIPEWATEFAASPNPARQALATDLLADRALYVSTAASGPALLAFVTRYNWLSTKANQAATGIQGNEARNLSGALMQDYLGQLLIRLADPYPSLEVFEEANVAFGRYPLWKAGAVRWRKPKHKPDLTVGHRYMSDAAVDLAPQRQPDPTRLGDGEEVVPLVMVSSKIRISMPEFFDWLGRETLVSKGNPSSLSLQIGLRAPIDKDVVAASQSLDNFFVLGAGGPGGVVADPAELTRLEDRITAHVKVYMT